MKWYHSRAFNYVLFGMIYLILNKMVGFESAVLIGIGTIIGEQTFVNYEKRKMEN